MKRKGLSSLYIYEHRDIETYSEEQSVFGFSHLVHL